MDLLNQLHINQHYIWASFLWGTIASGYLIYGWKQRATIPLIGGILMSVASIFVFSALMMSLACVIVMFAVWWFCRQGY